MRYGSIENRIFSKFRKSPESPGVVGVGATGEAWAGSGVEAGVNVGINDRTLSFGGKAGLGLGVGGKVGVNRSLDYGKVIDLGQETGQNVGQWGQRTGRDVQPFSQGASRNVQ
ncbi:MAG: hypothetical protein ACI814_004774 [Mariniblastus sp.]